MKAPFLSEQEVRDILAANGVDQSKVAVVGIRGHLGSKGANTRRIYDDAMYIVSPRGVLGFRANTDPNGWRNGIATLQPGIHLYGTGRHKGRLAFRQCEHVTVKRDGQSGRMTGMYAINIHDGGANSTSSLGCQTLAPEQWGQFRPLMYSLLDEFKNPFRNNDWGQSVRCFPYVLIEETDRAAERLVVSKRYL